MERSTDREKVINGLEQFRSDFKPFCGNSADWKRVDDAIVLLKEQEQEISFLKAMQFQTVKGMDERELGEIVGKTLGLWR